MAHAQDTEKSVMVFYSYCHQDERFREILEKHLSVLRNEGVISEWHDRNIDAGKDWEEEINLNLKAADLIIVLLSPDFLASNYCWNVEVKTALDRHQRGDARVIPVVLRPCDWLGTPLGKLQALPRDGKPVTSWRNRDEAFLDIVIGIRHVASDLKSLGTQNSRKVSSRIISQLASQEPLDIGESTVNAFDLGLAAHFRSFANGMSKATELIEGFFGKFYPGLFLEQLISTPPPSLHVTPGDENSVEVEEHFFEQLKLVVHEDFFSFGACVARLAVVEGMLEIYEPDSLGDAELGEVELLLLRSERFLLSYNLASGELPSLVDPDGKRNITVSVKSFVPEIRKELRQSFENVPLDESLAPFYSNADVFATIFELGYQSAVRDFLQGQLGADGTLDIEMRIGVLVNHLDLSAHKTSLPVGQIEQHYRLQFPGGRVSEVYDFGCRAARIAAGDFFIRRNVETCEKAMLESLMSQRKVKLQELREAAVCIGLSTFNDKHIAYEDMLNESEEDLGRQVDTLSARIAGEIRCNLAFSN